MDKKDQKTSITQAKEILKNLKKHKVPFLKDFEQEINVQEEQKKEAGKSTQKRLRRNEAAKCLVVLNQAHEQLFPSGYFSDSENILSEDERKALEEDLIKSFGIEVGKAIFKFRDEPFEKNMFGEVLKMGIKVFLSQINPFRSLKEELKYFRKALKDRSDARELLGEKMCLCLLEVAAILERSSGKALASEFSDSHGLRLYEALRRAWSSVVISARFPRA